MGGSRGRAPAATRRRVRYPDHEGTNAVSDHGRACLTTSLDQLTHGVGITGSVIVVVALAFPSHPRWQRSRIAADSKGTCFQTETHASVGTMNLATDVQPAPQGDVAPSRSAGRHHVVNVQPRSRRLPIRRNADMTIHIRIRNTTMASVIWTHRPKFPIEASMRSPHGYGRWSHAPSIIVVVVRFHQVSISGTYSQP